MLILFASFPLPDLTASHNDKTQPSGLILKFSSCLEDKMETWRFTSLEKRGWRKRGGREEERKEAGVCRGGQAKQPQGMLHLEVCGLSRGSQAFNLFILSSRISPSLFPPSDILVQSTVSKIDKSTASQSPMPWHFSSLPLPLKYPTLLNPPSANHTSNPTPEFAHEGTEIQREEVIHWRRVGRFLQDHVIKAQQRQTQKLENEGGSEDGDKRTDHEMTLRSVMVWIVQSLIPGGWRPHRFPMYLSCSLSIPISLLNLRLTGDEFTCGWLQLTYLT